MIEDRWRKLVPVLCMTCWWPTAQPSAAGPVTVTPLESGAEASFRGIGVFGHKIVWVGGTEGTVLRSVDAGETWQAFAIPEASALDFRDLQILDEETVLLMSVGPGESSRIYKTTDGGESWKTVLVNREEQGFFNGIAFWDRRAGLLTGDPVDGKLWVLLTEDGGDSWRRVGAASLPPVLEPEHGFAASGSGVAVAGSREAWIGTGGTAARVFRTPDRGESWTVVTTPMASGNDSSGIFSLAFRDGRHGLAVGGDYLDPEMDKGNVARTEDGGKSWSLVRGETPMRHKAGVRYLGGDRVLAVGRTGIAWSDDGGEHWREVSPEPYFCIGYDEARGLGYLAGGDGRLARFRVR